jgi:hypothetical protein
MTRIGPESADNMRPDCPPIDGLITIVPRCCGVELRRAYRARWPNSVARVAVSAMLTLDASSTQICMPL